MRHHEDDKDYVTSGMWNEVGLDAPEALNAAGIESRFVVKADSPVGSDVEPMNIERHTAIRCVHSPGSLTAIVGEIVGHYVPAPPASLTVELVSTFTKLMWDHADEIANAYKDILRRNHGR